jgi:hypothetical protein
MRFVALAGNRLSPRVCRPPDRRPQRRRSPIALLCAAGLVALASTSNAVQQPAQIGDPGLQQAGVPDSVPNISGVWQLKGYERRIKPYDGSETPWQPWTLEAFNKRAAAEKEGRPLYDPTAGCQPSGIPRIIVAPYPQEIIQTPDQIIFMIEVMHTFRIVYLNARHPDNLEPSHFGHSIGHWEGDTLVIDTIGFVKQTQIDEAGTLHSDQMHVVQRIRKVGDALEILFTIDDPGAFTKPWTAKRIWQWRPDVRFSEYVCEENNRNAPGPDGVLRNL